LLTGFATSTFANALKGKSKEELTEILITQLNEMFGDKQGFKIVPAHLADPADEKKSMPAKPASTYFLDSLVQDWSQEPFIKGGYT
jgi:hypothetical protein